MEIQMLQPRLYEQFKQIIQQNRLSHAYLFSGNFGNFDLALWVTKSLFCDNKQDALPCEDCRSCRLIMANQFSDVTVVEPQGQLIKTDTIRELTKDFSRSGFEGHQQVFIVKDADKMHVNAANSLLKFIEEPVSQVYIFLLTADENKMLPTIKSRCQTYYMIKQVDYLIDILMREGVLKTQANILAQISSSVPQAISYAHNAKVLELLVIIEKFAKQLNLQPNLAYLGVSKLVGLANDKDLQMISIDMLTVVLAQQKVPELLTKCYRLKKMWQANVSFQNALEYFVLDSMV